MFQIMVVWLYDILDLGPISQTILPLQFELDRNFILLSSKS